MKFIVWMTLLSLLEINAASGASSDSKEKTLKYFSAKDKAFREMKFVQFENATLSASCIKNQKARCEAYSAFKKKEKDPDRSQVGVLGNPAGLYCAAFKARNLIFIDQEKREYDYCFFSDGSAIDAWHLYKKHH